MINLGKDFYGSTYVWFTGIVENIHDPLAVGRVQVRILGVHSQNKVDLPTEKLPWAQVLLPPNASFTFSAPKVGDWVEGFFQDGHSAQIPVVRGVYSGLWKETTVIDSTVINNKFSKFSQSSNPQQVYERKDGEPTVPPSSRNQVEGTMIQKTNDDLAKNCDIVPEFETITAWITIDFSATMQIVREQILAIVKSLGSDPSGITSSIVSKLKKLNLYIQNINDLLKEVAKYKELIVEVAKKIRAIIDYILSLPAKFIKFLQDCLKYFLGGIKNFLLKAVKVEVKVEGAELGDIGEAGDLEDLLKEVGTTINNVKAISASVAEVASIPVLAVEALVNPSSPEDMAKAEADIKSFVNSLTEQQSDPKYVEDRTFNLTNTP